MGRVIACILLVFTSALAGCSAPRPLDATLISDARWRAVLDVYDTAVHSTQSDPHWHHHWLGNLTVINQGSPHQGLCWQWRDHLDITLAPVLARHRLAALGIHARRGTPMEHNALLIYDPEMIDASALLTAPAPTSDASPVALVLDPWFSGTPAIFSVPEWSRLSWTDHPVGVDPRPFPVGELSPPTCREASPSW